MMITTLRPQGAVCSPDACRASQFFANPSFQHRSIVIRKSINRAAMIQHNPVVAWLVSSSLLLSQLLCLHPTNGFAIGQPAVAREWTTKTACVDPATESRVSQRLGLGSSKRLRGVPSSSSSLSSTTSSEEPPAVVENNENNKRRKRELTDQQTDFCLGYLNQHHGSFLYAVATSLSEVADEMAQANAWSGGSYTVLNATAEAISTNDMIMKIVVEKRGGRIETRRVTVPLNPTDVTAVRRRLKTVPPPVPEDSGDDDDISRLPIDDVCRKLVRLAWMVGHPDVSGKLIQLAIQLDGAGIGKLPGNMQVFIFIYLCMAGKRVACASNFFVACSYFCLLSLFSPTTTSGT
jgi:hypothetical protein